MSRRYLNPPKLFPSQQYGFSQGVLVTGSRTIYLSGQVAWDETQRIVGRDDLGGQTRQALRNIQIALEESGAGLDQVVSMRIYILIDRMEENHYISSALLSFFPPDRLPATTWIGVPALARDEFLVEIEAIAVLDD